MTDDKNAVMVGVLCQVLEAVIAADCQLIAATAHPGDAIVYGQQGHPGQYEPTDYCTIKYRKQGWSKDRRITVDGTNHSVWMPTTGRSYSFSDPALQSKLCKSLKLQRGPKHG